MERRRAVGTMPMIVDVRLHLLASEETEADGDK